MRVSQLQTPQRDHTPANRRLKTASDFHKKLHKGARKSFNPLFEVDNEGDHSVLESLKEFSEASDESLVSESVENFFASVHPTETVAVSHLPSIALSSVTATPSKHIAFDTANNPGIASFKMAGSIEAEIVIKHLKVARIQAFKSKDAGPSKKLVEALINIVIEELHGGLYEKNEWLDKLLSRSSSLGFLIYIMGISSLFMVWFLKWCSEGSFAGLTPT